MDPEIPLAWPQFEEAEAEALSRVLHSHRWSVGGALLAFESELAALAGRQHGVGVNSGTSALQIALQALDVQPGDEVILPAYTFVGPVNAVLAAGATPVLADVDPLTLNLDPAAVEALIGPRTRVLMPVHLFGRPAAMSELMAIANQHSLRVVEDACESVGATTQGQPVGGIGDIGCYAFYPNKPIAVGEGGMLVLNDEALALRCRQLRNQGFDPQSGAYLEDRHGHSARLSEWHAAIGSVQLARLPTVLRQRADLAEGYRQRLQRDRRIELPAPASDDQQIAWFTYPIRLVASLASRRDWLLTELRAAGIGCNTYFTPVHRLPYHRGRYRCGRLTVSDDIGSRCLALPLHHALDDAALDRICEALIGLLDRG